MSNVRYNTLPDPLTHARTPVIMPSSRHMVRPSCPLPPPSPLPTQTQEAGLVAKHPDPPHTCGHA